jgi:hypothetical protein
MRTGWRNTLCGLAALLCAAASSPAMTVETHGSTVFATGRVDNDLRKFEEALDKPGVDTVVFVNSPGGDLWTALRVGRLIAGKDVKTVAAGPCLSACAVMFLGGVERRFADAFAPSRTLIGIHGAHNAETKSLEAQVQPQIFAFFKQRMGERFDATVMNQALYEMRDAGAMLVVPESSRNPKAATRFCPAAQSVPADCTIHKDRTALALGVITHDDLAKVALPDAFKPADTVLGRASPFGSSADTAQRFAQISDTHCAGEACVRISSQWAGAQGNRAVATRVQGKGMAVTTRAATPTAALLAAVAACNHLKGVPVALCQAEIVDEHDVRALDQEALRAHVDALGRIAPPTERFHADEEYGGTFTSADGLRTEKYKDMTPKKLEGITTLGTKDLAEMLATQAPFMIDVEGAFETLPGSKALIYGGIAFADEGKDKAYQERFAMLLKLLCPDPSFQLVFFGSGRESWFAVNAALRAQRLGYTRVMWYRGGIASWRAARLPTAPLIVRAVAN